MRRVQGCGLLLQTFRAVCVPAGQKREPYTKMAEPIEMLFGFWTRAGPHGAQQQTRRTPLLWSNDGTDRRTDGRTLGRYIDLGPRTMRTVAVIKYQRIELSRTDCASVAALDHSVMHSESEDMSSNYLTAYTNFTSNLSL